MGWGPSVSAVQQVCRNPEASPGDQFRRLLSGKIDAPKGSAFTVEPQIAGPLSDPRMGKLAGKITPQRLHELVNSNTASRFFDTRAGNINIIQNVDGKLLRVTVAGDKFKIISVGPIRERNITNRIKNGGFVPLVPVP